MHAHIYQNEISEHIYQNETQYSDVSLQYWDCDFF